MKIKINKDVIMWILLTIPFMSSPFCNQYLFLDYAFKIGEVIAALFIIWLTVFYRYQPSYALLLITCMHIWVLFTTICNGADIGRCVSTIAPVIFVSLLYDIGMRADSIQTFVTAQYVCFSIVIYVNFISEILYPHGMYVSDITYYWQNWILGYYNNHSVYYFMALCMALLYMEMNRKYIGPICLIGVIYASALMVRSAGVIGSLLLALVLLISLYVTKKLIGNYYIYWSTHIAFFIIVVLGNSSFWEKIMIYCQQIFGKGSSFYARYRLWKTELMLLSQKPILGYGIESQQARLNEYGWALHSHNLILEILHRGGVVHLIIFIVLVVIAGKRLMESNNSLIIGIISICCMGWVIDTLTEPFMTPFVVTLLIVAYNAKNIHLYDSCTLSYEGK